MPWSVDWLEIYCPFVQGIGAAGVWWGEHRARVLPTDPWNLGLCVCWTPWLSARPALGPKSASAFEDLWGKACLAGAPPFSPYAFPSVALCTSGLTV